MVGGSAIPPFMFMCYTRLSIPPPPLLLILWFCNDSILWFSTTMAKRGLHQTYQIQGKDLSQIQRAVQRKDQCLIQKAVHKYINNGSKNENKSITITTMIDACTYISYSYTLRTINRNQTYLLAYVREYAILGGNTPFKIFLTAFQLYEGKTIDA